MKVRAEFKDRQPDYRYMPLGNGKADVFIYNFIEEKQDEEDNSSSFIYEQNEFRVNSDEITEKMIKENLNDYLNYTDEEINIDLEQRVVAIEEAIVELAEVMLNG